MFLNGNVSGHVTMHYRELEPGPPFLKGTSINRVGRVVSVDSRTTMTIISELPNAGPRSTGGWSIDMAHQPSMVYVPYLITGDWYFLDELYMWAAFNLGNTPASFCSSCRGNEFGYISEQVRGEAWGLRALAHAAYFAPDGTAEKTYFSQKLNNNIAMREGRLGVRDGAFYDPAPNCASPCTSVPWRFGRDVVSGSKPNPLYYLSPGSTGLITGIDPAKAIYQMAPWMANFQYLVYGHIEDLGFKIQTLRKTALRHLLHQLADPAYNPWLSDFVQIPVQRTTAAGQTEYFSNWGQVKDAFTAAMQNRQAFTSETDTEHGYANIARAAASYLTDVDDVSIRGVNAWNWIERATNNKQLLSVDPKWAIVPRSAASQNLAATFYRERILRRAGRPLAAKR